PSVSEVPMSFPSLIKKQFASMIPHGHACSFDLHQGSIGCIQLDVSTPQARSNLAEAATHASGGFFPFGGGEFASDRGEDPGEPGVSSSNRMDSPALRESSNWPAKIAHQNNAPIKMTNASAIGRSKSKEAV